MKIEKNAWSEMFSTHVLLSNKKLLHIAGALSKYLDGLEEGTLKHIIKDGKATTEPEIFGKAELVGKLYPVNNPKLSCIYDLWDKEDYGVYEVTGTADIKHKTKFIEPSPYDTTAFFKPYFKGEAIQVAPTLWEEMLYVDFENGELQTDAPVDMANLKKQLQKLSQANWKIW